MFEHGITHVSLANNHALDFGESGLENTKKVLQANNIVPMGTPNNIASSSLAYIELATSTISVIAIHAVAVDPELDQIADLLERAQERAQYHVVYIHWGDEYVSTHNQRQQSMARQLIDAGADAVIGHHPHVVQDIQLYRGKPIFYSLGNFVFDQYFSQAVQEGLLLELSFTNDATLYRLVPVTSVGSRTRPRVMTGYERHQFLESLATRSHQSLFSNIRNGLIKI